jgi:putative copper export protein/mono/diheme cytochrome c family protein
MEGLLIASRALHFAAAISLTGVFGFECLIATPALRGSGLGPAAARLRRRFNAIAWIGVGLAVVSGAAWLTSTSASMSGQSLAAVISRGVLSQVLTQTRFGRDWLLRLCLAALIALCIPAREIRVVRWLVFALAAAMLASLAWGGHGGATPGAPGDLHLAGDILHLLGAGLWLGTLVPLELLLAEASRAGAAGWLSAARIAARRFTYVAIASVAALLAGGSVNTWFLAGTIPALIGTEYGRLVLAKIGLFIAMLLVASVNLLRLTPRLSDDDMANPTIARLQRNALIETALGLGVVAIVGFLGTLPPGLHSEPGWPLPFRLEIRALSVGATIAAVVGAFTCVAGAGATVVVVARARYRIAPVLAAGAVLGAIVTGVALRSSIEPAYPTSFYAPAEAYAAPSIVRGATLYAENCESCHGATGRGDGPAAASLSIRPANLTEAHLFTHTPGDLFWWVSQGRADGAMPGFASVMNPSERWDVINFIRARAASILIQQTGPRVTMVAAYPVPDFAFEQRGKQNTLRQTLNSGPVLLVLFNRQTPIARLHQLAATSSEFARTGLQVIATGLGAVEKSAGEEPTPLFAVSVDTNARTAISLFRSPADGGETELLLDRNGDVRARWTAAAAILPDAATLAADAAITSQFSVAAPSHAGHGD